MSKPLSRRILERTRALIADKDHWWRGSLARDVRGHQVDPYSDEEFDEDVIRTGLMVVDKSGPIMIAPSG